MRRTGRRDFRGSDWLPLSLGPTSTSKLGLDQTDKGGAGLLQGFGQLEDGAERRLLLQALRAIVNQLPVDGMYRAALHRSLGCYADQIISRPRYAPDEGWDDLEALQQVTLGDMMEEPCGIRWGGTDDRYLAARAGATLPWATTRLTGGNAATTVIGDDLGMSFERQLTESTRRSNW